jgi:monoamine oxidase
MLERGVWIGGEHASPFEELGTVAGAYLSGERVAGRIVEKYGKGDV